MARALPHALRTSDCVVDGELCMLDEDGRPSFSLMQRGEGSPAYYLFDLLELERRPLIDQPLEQRREQLAELLVEGNPLVRLSAGFEDGAALLRAVVAQDLEGVVAKRLGSPYRPGRRTADWVKVKTRQDGEFLVLGWTAGQGSREALGALVLGEGEGKPPGLGRQRRQRAGRAQHRRAAAPDGAAAVASRRSIRCRRCPRRRPGW